MIIMKLKFLLLFFPISIFAQVSPFGTGQIINQVIGNLQNPAAVFQSNSGYGNNGFLFDPSTILPTNTYDIYVPTTYDGSEPYGLITYIDSDNDGGFQASWIPVLEERKLIWIAADNAGNTVNTDYRISAGWSAVYRMKELFNIDDSRIYASGQSGGARMAQTLAYIYPEWITGSLPLCGASYPLMVDQDYETNNPDSHYEVILNFTQADVNYIKGFDRRYAVMTSFDDFREGDIMNIYYGGFDRDGIDGKFLETAGGHCATSAIHFRDALNFVEHPDQLIQNDDFTNQSPATGLDYQRKNSGIENSKMILFDNQIANEDVSFVKTRNGISWNNTMGSIVETSFKWDIANSQSAVFSMSAIEFESDELYCRNNGFINDSTSNKIAVFIVNSGNMRQAHIVSYKPNAIDTLFSGQFLDWTGLTDLKIKWHLWNNEWRVEFSEHFSSSIVLNASVRLLDDLRAVRIRWAEMNSNVGYWNSTDWSNGAYIILGAQKAEIQSLQEVQINQLSFISGAENHVFNTNPQISISQNSSTLTAESGFATYNWFLNGQIISTSNSPILLDCVEGEYYVEAVSENGCIATSNAVIVDFAMILESDIVEPMIYPNPSHGQIFINSLKALQSVTIRDMTGRAVYFENKVDNGLKEILINATYLNPANYIVEIVDGTSVYYKKISIR